MRQLLSGRQGETGWLQDSGVPASDVPALVSGYQLLRAETTAAADQRRCLHIRDRDPDRASAAPWPPAAAQIRTLDPTPTPGRACSLPEAPHL